MISKIQIYENLVNFRYNLKQTLQKLLSEYEIMDNLFFPAPDGKSFYDKPNSGIVILEGITFSDLTDFMEVIMPENVIRISDSKKFTCGSLVSENQFKILCENNQIDKSNTLINLKNMSII